MAGSKTMASSVLATVASEVRKSSARADTWRILDQVASPALEKIIARAAAEEADDGEGTDDEDLRNDPAAAIDLAPVLTAALRQYLTQVEATGTRAEEYLIPSQATMLCRVLSETAS